MITVFKTISQTVCDNYVIMLLLFQFPLFMIYTGSLPLTFLLPLIRYSQTPHFFPHIPLSDPAILELKNEMLENIDFVFVPTQCWTYLVDLYGLSDNDTAIYRKVLEFYTRKTKRFTTCHIIISLNTVNLNTTKLLLSPYPHLTVTLWNNEILRHWRL